MRGMLVSTLIAAVFVAAEEPRALTLDEAAFGDFDNAISSTNDDIGSLDPGSNTLSGSLMGDCIINILGSDCNPTTMANDTQDSLLFSVAPGHALVGVGVSSMEVTALSGLTFFVTITESAHLGSGIADANKAFAVGTDGELLDPPDRLGPALYELSLGGFQADTTGSYAFDYTLTFAVEVPEPGVPFLALAAGLGALWLLRSL